MVTKIVEVVDVLSRGSNKLMLLNEMKIQFTKNINMRRISTTRTLNYTLNQFINYLIKII